MGFRDNLEEKQELYEYRKKERRLYIVFFLIISFMFLIIASTIMGSGAPAKTLWMRIPFANGTGKIDFVLFLIFVYFYIWAKGVPKILTLPAKIPFVGKYISKQSSNIATKLPLMKKAIEKGGQSKYLENFFYPEVSFSDGIKRGKGFYYFKAKKITIDTLFDFGDYSHSDDFTGTERIKYWFRDKEQEELRRDVKTLKGKKAKKSQKILDNILKQANGKPTENQQLLYHDLFLMLEGIYHSYANDFGDKIFIGGKEFKSPISVMVNKKSGEITDIRYDDNADIFKDGKVYFSITMIRNTVKTLTKLYMIFLKKRLERGRFSEIDTSVLERFETFFKFFMMRRLLLSYSNIPAGWLCVKIEDYSARAIASNIDREMIIDINEKNDGSSTVYNSDVEATQFLFTYWAFMHERRIKKMMESLEFTFNASKEVKEINARKVALKAIEEINKEHKETYDAIKDEDLVILAEKEES